jgi:hypothetical protein
MKKLCYLLLLCSGINCREKYDVFIDVPDRGLLVVEGYVNGNGRTRITLSRTTLLSEKKIVPELHAVLVIEGEDNSTNYLYDIGDGVYVTDSIQLDPSLKYRLRIYAFNQEEYLTDFRSIVATPAIDSISHVYNDGIVNFYSHSKNSDDRSIYYKWDYDETWEFKSTFRATLQYKITGQGAGRTFEIEYYDSVNHTHNESIYTCWKNNKSTGIILGSAAQVGDEPINLPVRTLARNAFQLTYLYSILVTQYGLRADSYEFFRRMKKNSESLGTIFDAQPSELVGNIVCVTNPHEEVIGFVEFTRISQKRYFVYGPFLPGTPYDPDCPFWEELDPNFGGYPYENDPDLILQVFYHRGLVPTIPEKIDPVTKHVLTFYAERPRCVDCTMRGSNIKPDFWP